MKSRCPSMTFNIPRIGIMNQLKVAMDTGSIHHTITSQHKCITNKRSIITIDRLLKERLNGCSINTHKGSTILLYNQSIHSTSYLKSRSSKRSSFFILTYFHKFLHYFLVFQLLLHTIDKHHFCRERKQIITSDIHESLVIDN